MAAQNSLIRVSAVSGFLWSDSGECRGNSSRWCTGSRPTPRSSCSMYNMSPSTCFCSCCDTRTNISGTAQAAASAGPEHELSNPSVAVGEAPVADAAAAPVAAAALITVNSQAVPLTQRRLSTLRTPHTRETDDSSGNCYLPCLPVRAAAARASAAPSTCEVVNATKAATVETAGPQPSSEGLATSTAAVDVPLGQVPLAWHLHRSNFHDRRLRHCSCNIFNDGGSNGKYGSGNYRCSQNIHDGSYCTGGSRCFSSNSRSGSTVHRLPVSRTCYAACRSRPAAASTASAATSGEHQPAVDGSKKHSDVREQQLLERQHLQKNEEDDPRMLKIMRTHAFLHLTSGAVAGAVSRTATAPLDRLKVMLQLQPFSVPLRQAARVIMQQELSGKASGVGCASTAAVVADALSSSSNPRSSSKNQRSPQTSRSVERGPSKQFQQQHGVRADVRSASTVRSSSNGSCCCSTGSNRMSSSGHLLLGGWRGFFRGNLTNCLKVVPETAVKFYSYDICKHALAHRKQQQQQPQQQHQQGEQGEPHLQLLDRFLCGATAGLCAQLLIYPMELVKTRLAAYGPGCMYTGVLQCFRAIYKEGGFRRLYRGVGPSLLGIIPYAGIDLAVFETLKEAYVQRVIVPRQQQQLDQQPLQLRPTCNNCISETSPGGMVPFAPGATAATGGAPFASGSSRSRCCCDESSSSSGLPPASPPAAVLLLMGGCSSLIGQVLAYPTALVRTRMQVDGSGGQPLLYRSSAAAAAAAVRQGGLRGLYRGLQANCCKALPAVSLSWIVYEKMKYAISSFERDWSQKVEQQRLAAKSRP